MRFFSKCRQRMLAVVAIAVIMMGGSYPVQAVQTNFTDVKKEDYFYEAVHSFASRGILSGYGDKFKPYQPVTRAQAAKMLALVLGLDTKNVKDPGFTDVKKADWYYGPVAALVEAGIIKGDGNKFKPYETLNRAQMAKMVALGFGFQQGKAPTQFTDVKSSDWFSSYVGILVEKGITKGTTPTTFSPYRAVTRGQLAAFLFRAEQSVVNSDNGYGDLIIEDIL
jgi:hypothetical protein